MSQFPAKCSPPAKTSLPLRPRVILGWGGGTGGGPGPRTRHADPARLPKTPPLLGNRALSRHLGHTHTHRTHRRTVIWSLHLISTPKARDESDPWKIKIDGRAENRTARKSSPKRDVEGKREGSCPSALKCQTQFRDSFPHEGASVPPKVPGLGGRTMARDGRRHPRGDSPSYSARLCRPRKGNSALGPGRPKPGEALISVAAPEASSPLLGATPPRLPLGRRPHAPSPRSAGLGPGVLRPDPMAGRVGVSRQRWERGGWASCAP